MTESKSTGGQRLPENPRYARETITSADVLRHFIGFDPLDRLQANVGNFPPHNIEQITEDRFVLTLAVAGFKRDEIAVTLNKGFLSVAGVRNRMESTSTDRKFLHQGISARDFVREFKLGENVEVNDAKLEDGLLQIRLDRIVPDEDQPQRITIL